MSDHGNVILNDRYEMQQRIGRGGMADVYLARDVLLDRLVAIKVLFPEFATDPAFVERFRREAQSAANLNHPNIVRTFDLDPAGAIHFIAMEYVAGTDLDAKVKAEGPLPLRDALDYLRQTALGLEHAHEEGLVHRDIKPANLILDARGTVKILDLGLALAPEEDQTSLTKTHDEKVLGTADYLSPEQARDSHLADARSDIYALGCTLHYLLTGRPPFAEGTMVQKLLQHQQAEAPAIDELRPEVPRRLAAALQRLVTAARNAGTFPSGEVAAVDVDPVALM